MLTLLVVLRVDDVRPLEQMRLAVVDMYQQVMPRALTTGSVAIVDVDERSLAELGQWPWSRRTIATMIERLTEAGASVIGFDVLFAEADRLSPPAFAAGDDTLPDALRAVLSTMPDTDAWLAEVIAGAPVVLGRAMTADPAVRPALRESRVTPMASYGGDPAPYLFAYPGLLANLPVLEAEARGLGSFTLTPEPDGMVRRVPLILRAGETVQPALSLEMLRVFLGETYYRVHNNPQGAGIEAVSIGDVHIPTDGSGRVWMRFAESAPELYISAADILAGRFDAAAVDGKMVLVGTSATGLRDLRVTPLSESIPGVEVHAQLIDSILAGDISMQPPYALGVELVLTLLGGIALIFLVPRAGARTSLAVLAAVLVVAWGMSVYGYFAQSLLIDATLPTVAGIALFTLLAYANYARAERKRREIRTAFSQYLSPALVQQLEEHPDRLRLGGEMRELTFVFTDLAGFTAMVERSEPAELVATLNEYLDGMCGIVIKHGGTIDKIVGDAVHAMFGAPIEMDDHAPRAVRCAIELDGFGHDFARRMAARGFAFGATRIGVNTGRVVVGNFGGSRRLDYTAHGDAINMAARLEAANKWLGTSVCVAGSTAALCPDVRFRPIGQLQLRGVSQPVETFEPVRADADLDHAAGYAKAYALLQRGDPSARQAFARLAERTPDDPLAALHLKRIEAGRLDLQLVPQA